MSETDLENCLREYQSQLSSVEAALLLQNEDRDLQELKANLQEAIDLTEESLVTLRKEKLLALLSNLEKEGQNAGSIESELERFQSELENDAASKEVETVSNDTELNSTLMALEGQKCRVSFKQEWGDFGYHNAVILNVKSNEIESMDDLKVDVMFCNPTCQSMKPCNFFMEGHCRFDAEQCRFSHGYSVKLSDVQEFLEPDFSNLKRDSYCLAKYKDGLWYRALVEEVHENHTFTVKYSSYNEIDTLELEDILPLDIENDSSSSDSDSDLLSSDDDVVIIENRSMDYKMGEWEQFTKGIGSKLMEQMGYIKGKGLGKNGEGRIDPIEVIILPQGKSLDKCIEIRKRKEQRESLKAENAKNNETSKKGLPSNNVFDFINSKMNLSKKQTVHQNTSSKDLRESSSKGLNIKLLKITEDVKKSEKEIGRLKQSLARNRDRDRIMQSQIEQKIANQEKILFNLKKQEALVGKEQQSRKDRSKITIF